MRKYLLLFVIASLPAVWNPTWGQSPRVGKEASRDKKDNAALGTGDTKPPERGTKDAPFIVDTQGHVDTPDEAAKHEQDENHKSLVDRWTVGEAIAVAVFTGLLVYIGWRGVNAANKTLLAVEEQTGATKASIDVLINSERSWVLVSPVDGIKATAFIPVTPGAIRPYNQFRFRIANRGKTVAKLMEIKGSHRIIEGYAELPGSPEYPHIQVSEDFGFIHGGILAPEDSIEAFVNITDPISAERFEQILGGRLKVFVYAYIRYFDFAKTERQLQFCYIFRPQVENLGPMWVIAGAADGCPSAYNTHT